LRRARIKASKGQTGAIVENTARYVGIDVSKDHFDVHVRPDDREQRFNYDNDGLQGAVSLIKEVRPRLIVMEATGGYEQRLVAVFATQAFPVAVINAKRVRETPGLRIRQPNVVR